ncbi:hypothetical protein KKJ01_17595 [Xenorhabdus bovienii]|uniref:Uncharacterized protein n=1 Tax=Xenorhabdus bovienii TaxID=40576 RepID=A0AAJ1JE69_XENBV|nr:hypothetical protein [Xenorhabdus bovienii]MDE1479983.1 hypothetical protein [Xenorhabdus bovienii]MDE9511680.1 hypothetical protein [Xenorhabdus bovienii]MDE9523322.1 hypothetical protein [Xenorhabdus bovienii]
MKKTLQLSLRVPRTYGDEPENSKTFYVSDCKLYRNQENPMPADQLPEGEN